jgi:membrane-associated phospholipid phosphatase
MRVEVPVCLFLLGIITPEVMGAGWKLDKDLENIFSSASILPAVIGLSATSVSFLLEDKHSYPGLFGSSSFLCFEREVLDPLFSPILLFSGAGLAWGAGELLDSHSLSETGSDLTEALLITFAGVGGLKIFAGRRRPDQSDEMSFPSWHAASAGCITAVMWEREGWEIGVPLAALTGIVCLSRIDLGKHYPSDVIAGASIGIIIGAAVAKSSIDDENYNSTIFFSWDSRFGAGVSIR